ncbi:helix-turn-helix transcriptional regulator [Cryobacterium sp. TMT4-31]|uniref:helix-turn-helix transcriptional regulator n=1 Tax=Cryobacterium sp. TMT4-31 TaxID=1259259 RepID=UPI00141B3B2D|nr:helix-turn-helix transcriptional regulator [Cryobacterium sp. TMT4-31]
MANNKTPRDYPWEANFREQMRRRREAQGMTQTDLARGLSRKGLPFHQQTIQRIESGERPIRLDEAYLIANKLETPMDTMLSAPDTEFGEIRDAVERIRREVSGELNGGIIDVFDEWQGHLSALDVAFEALLARAAGEATAEVRWAAAWLIKAVRVDDALRALFKSMHCLAGDVVETGTDGIADHRRPLLAADYALWQGLQPDQNPVHLADLDPGAFELASPEAAASVVVQYVTASLSEFEESEHVQHQTAR